MKTINLGPFLGINNRLPDFALRANDPAHPARPADFLRSADNVDINDVGKIVRRAGTTRVQALSDPHSLLKTDDVAFVVRSSALYAITLPSYSETLLKVLSNDDRVSYARLGDSWYFSNGTDAGRVTAGTAYPMGLPTPDAPTLSAIGGALDIGRYQVVISYAHATTGEEGGVSTFATIDLAAVGGIRVPLPGATTGATHVNIYLSTANGGVPYLAATVTAATSSHDLTATATGREATVRREAPLPAGTLFVRDGRLCSFAGPMIYVGLPFRPGYYLPAEGFIPFPEDVTIAATVTDGLYVTADKTYFIPGDIGDTQSKDKINDVLPTGAVPGTLFNVPDTTSVGWFGLRGFVIGDAQGNAVESIRENVDLTPPSSGIAHVCECDGYKRVFSCGWVMNLKTNAVTTYSDWDFSSASGCYATKSDGIYRVDDDAAPVDAVVGLGKQDFGAAELKHLPALYLGVDASAPMELRVQTPGGNDYTYKARSSSAELRQQRVDVGKGLRANWFDLTLMNTGGAKFTLANASFDPSITQRRI